MCNAQQGHREPFVYGRPRICLTTNAFLHGSLIFGFGRFGECGSLQKIGTVSIVWLPWFSRVDLCFDNLQFVSATQQAGHIFQKSTSALIPKTKKVEEGPSPMASKAATTQIAHVARRRWDPKYSAWTRSHIAFKRPLGLCADCECRYIFALHWDEKSWEGHEASETMHLQTQQSLGKWHAGVYQPCK